MERWKARDEEICNKEPELAGGEHSSNRLENVFGAVAVAATLEDEDEEEIFRIPY